MKLLHIYGQPFWHADARIIGNTEGLTELREVIDHALRDGKAETSEWDDCLFTSDGEGYKVIVESHNGKWGLDGGKRAFWNHIKPEYTTITTSR